MQQDNKEHSATLDKTKIMPVDHIWLEWGVQEAIYIQSCEPFLNADGGRYKLLPAWNNLWENRIGRRTASVAR